MHEPHVSSTDQDPLSREQPHTTAAGLEAWLSGAYSGAPSAAPATSAPAEASVPEPAVSAPDLTVDPDREVGPVNAAEALVLGAFTNARKLGGADGAQLVVDPGLKTYYFESNTLKPLASLLLQPADRWIPIYTEALNATRAAYSAQSLERLLWYAGLIATPGILTRRLQRDQCYRLPHWPETEREFPRHFRIARAMLKDAASIEQIAHAAGVPRAEVVDYINACHAANRLEVNAGLDTNAPTQAPDQPPRKGRLMSRFDLRRLAR